MESLKSRKSTPSVKVSLAYSKTEYNIPATAILEGVKFNSTYSLQTNVQVYSIMQIGWG